MKRQRSVALLGATVLANYLNTVADGVYMFLLEP